MDRGNCYHGPWEVLWTEVMLPQTLGGVMDRGNVLPWTLVGVMDRGNCYHGPWEVLWTQVCVTMETLGGVLWNVTSDNTLGSA